MDFEVHCMSILHTKLSFFNYDKVKSVLQSITPLRHLAHSDFQNELILVIVIFVDIYFGVNRIK